MFDLFNTTAYSVSKAGIPTKSNLYTPNFLHLSNLHEDDHCNLTDTLVSFTLITLINAGGPYQI